MNKSFAYFNMTVIARIEADLLHVSSSAISAIGIYENTYR